MFEAVVTATRANRGGAVNAAAPYIHRRPGESRDDFALRLQIADTRPVLASGVWA